MSALKTNQVARQGIEELIAEKTAGDLLPCSFEVIRPFPNHLTLSDEISETPFLLPDQHWACLDQAIKGCPKKLGITLLDLREDIMGKPAQTRTKLKEGEGIWFTQYPPHFLDLSGDEATKNRMDVGACIIVAAFSDLFRRGVVVAVFRMVEGELHVSDKRDHPHDPDLLKDLCLEEFRLSSLLL